MGRIVAAITLLLAACPGSAFGQTDGRALYLSKCSACHARDGSGITTVGRSLNLGDIRPAIKNMTDEQLRQLVLEGRGKMPANKKFDDEKLSSLTLFLRDLVEGHPDTGRAVSQARSEPLEDAASVFQAKCSACHGRDGGGRTTVGKSLKVPDLTSAAVKARSDEDLTGIIAKGKGRMPAYAKTFNPVQIGQLVSYIRSLAPGADADHVAESLGRSGTAPNAPPAAASSAPPSVRGRATVQTTPRPPSGEPAATKPPIRVPAAKPPASPEQMYRARCAVCHSKDGSGTGTVGRSMGIPSLVSPELQAKSDEDLADVIRDGAGNMPAYKKKYSAEDIQRLVAYIRELAKK